MKYQKMRHKTANNTFDLIESTERRDKNEDKEMKRFEMVGSYLFSAVGILLEYQFYDTIAEHLFLRVCFYATVLMFGCMILTDIISFKNNLQGLKYFLRGMRYACFVAFAVCLLAGLYFRIEDNKVEITGEMVSGTESNIEEFTVASSESVDTEQDSFTDTLSFFEDGSVSNISEEDTTSNIPGIADDDSLLELEGYINSSDGFFIKKDGSLNSFYRITSVYTYIATISNYSQRSIEINVKDAVTLELLEFIPYDQLDLEVVPEGADIGFFPIIFHFGMDTNKRIQKVLRVTENDVDVDRNVYYTVEPNEIRKLSMEVSFQEEGLYRFQFSVNYYKKGVKYTYTFPECTCVFKELD